MQESKKKREMRSARILLFSMLVLICGLAVLLYPALNGIWTDWYLRCHAEEFLSFVRADPSAPQTPQIDSTHVIPSTPETEPCETLPEKYPELWQAMRDYNESICLSGQEGFSDKTAYEQPSFTLSDYGLESEVFAVLSIPALDLKMPLYLGATKQHMADGAAIMGQTSLPIGGSNTNCVIAGHRGWNGAAYFLYLPELGIGDTVQITNLWETLTYQVVDTQIITPYDVDSIRIQPNRELLTLLTCHPPATGGRERYLVFCERTQTELEVP